MHIKRLFAGAARLVSRRLPFPSLTGGLLRIPFEGTAHLRIFALLLAAAVFLPAIAFADTYPASRAVFGGGPARSTNEDACAAAVAQANTTGRWCQAGTDIMNCGTTGSLAGFVCGQPYPYENGFCEFGGGRHVTCPACPYGGTVSASGDTCEFAPPCPSGQVRDPKTGKCDLTQPQKTVGNPVDTNVCVG